MLRLLGPVRWETPAGSLDLGTIKQRTVLAALAVDAGHLVPWSELIDRVWELVPAAEPRRALYTYASRIRRLLAQVNAAEGSPPALLLRRSGGYLLEVDPDRVDLHRFHRLVTAAGTPLPDSECARLLNEALDLWQGRPLADLPGEWPERIGQAWRARRLETAVAWAEVQLRLSQPVPVIARARELAAEHPLAEPLMAILIQALAVADRQAEALNCYAGYRRRLVEELGAEPGPRLQGLHEAVLRGR